VAVVGFELRDFALVKQVLYCLSHAFNLFALIILKIGFLFLSRAAYTVILLF
jgi:hypothetical protein